MVLVINKALRTEGAVYTVGQLQESTMVVKLK